LLTPAEYIYAVLLRPRPLRYVANGMLRSIIPVSLERHGAKIVMNPNDPVVCGAITLGVYERPETRFFLSVCRPGMTYLDIGANIGYYTALAARRVGSQGRVIAVEPDPECYEYLAKTVAANGFLNVDLVPKAASESIGVATLYRNFLNRGDNRLYPNKLAIGRHTVETVTVDALLLQLGVTSVDLIKIDIQGFEGHALAGMERTLNQDKPMIILSEFWPQGLEDANTSPMCVLNIVADKGFKIFELGSRGRLKPVQNFECFIARYKDRQYTNIVALRASRTHTLNC